MRKLGQSALASLGFAGLPAGDGVEAMEVFRRHKDEVRCVVCDVTVPRMDGWETLAALRRLAPGLPVVLASGYDQAHVIAGDHPELPEAFVSKPYRLHELRDAIRRALAGKESLSGSPDTRAARPPTDTGSRKNSHGTWRSDDEHAEPLAVAICT